VYANALFNKLLANRRQQQIKRIILPWPNGIYPRNQKMV
jgi:hypothetical protein